ncbi:prolyl oligopeptidase family serine peptidase [Niabella sp.]|uniref:prolyl oligopeptidase family serine peptidase n=1 Tax=Niabella sp. TaxID=1962976 RepID=UPI003453C24D
MYSVNSYGHSKTHSQFDAIKATNPCGALATLSIPGLWLFGGKDVQVPVHLSIEHLDALKAKGKRYEYRVFPNLGHNMAFSGSQEPVTGAINWINTIKVR